MTKEEALKFILHNSFEDYEKHSVVMFIEKVIELKNKIYDDFENRTCKNCRWLTEEWCEGEHLYDYCIMLKIKGCDNNNLRYYHIEDKNFGCNKFERKE